MRAVKAKQLRKAAEKLCVWKDTLYTEKKTTKEVLTHDLDEQGKRIKKVVVKITKKIDPSCTRHIYQNLKRLG